MKTTTTKLRRVLVSLSLLLAAVSFAQTTGKITGTIVDKDTKEPIPGVNVLVEGTTLGAATDFDGKYVILRVPPGKHSLRASQIGYQNVVQREVEVLTDLTTTINFSLSQETVAVGEEVVVIAERPIIRKDLTSSEARVQAEEISRIPVQEVADVINLQAGIVRDAGGGIHIRGGRSTEVAYVVDGIRITDDFTRGQSLQVENESIQELQVVSGTFNAEYGQAMSGIINIVTKTGGNNFHGNFETWVSDYLSPRKEIFYNIDDINFLDNYNFQGSLSGPIMKDRITFFATARRWNDDGWLYGQNIFSPQGFIRNDSNFAVLGDGKPAPMNFRKRWSGQASLEWRLSGPLKLKLSALGSTEDKNNYNHFFKFNPLGDRGDIEKGGTLVANFTHAVTPRTFYEIKGAYKYNELVSRLYEDPFDSRYVDPRLLNAGLFQFASSGTDLGRFQRSTRSWLGKFDLTSQVSNRHQVKAGFEAQFDQVFLEDISLVPATDANGQQIQPFRPEIRPTSETTHDRFTRKPRTLSAYAQDKIEYESLIINVGLRLDVFEARGRVPVDLEDPNIFNPFKLNHIYKDLNNDGVIGLSEQTDGNRLTLAEREAFWYRDTGKKYQLSPRLGVAYPITERGVIHFSYGIFQQIPEYEQLYRRDELKVSDAAGTQGPFGNPDLNPQRTTMYELGLQQQISDDIGIDITGFYRDIRDWISTGAPLPTALAGVAYARKINRDFANVRGVTLSANRRLANKFSFNIDYTFQVVQGTNSTPEEEFFAQQGGAEPTRALTPLDWDQRHALNASIFVGDKDWGVSLIERLNSGQPYTPSIVTGTQTGRNVISGLEQNSRNKPNRFTIDLSGFKNFKFGLFDVQVFAKVFNALDAKNPINVFTDTGKPDVTLFQNQPGAASGIFVVPDFYSEPRRVQFGAKVSF